MPRASCVAAIASSTRAVEVGLATRDDALGWRRSFDALVARAAGVLRWPPDPERSGYEPTLKFGDFRPWGHGAPPRWPRATRGGTRLGCL